jgi:signal transduction histidine kinase
MSDLASAPAARQTVTMRVRLAAAGLIRDTVVRATADPAEPRPAGKPASAPAGAGTGQPDSAPVDAGTGQPDSDRVAAARSRAGERRLRQRERLRPLGFAFLAVVVIAGLQGQPAPGLAGTRLWVTAAIAGYVAAAAVGLSASWAERGVAAQVAVIALVGAAGVALAALQPHGAAELAASLGVWIAAVRLPTWLAAAAAGAITAALGGTIALTQHRAAQTVVAATLLCLLLAVTGRFIRSGREGQDHTELLLAQLQDAREAEAAAVALAERGRIAGELHDVLAHSLSGLAIQLQGARKLADAETVSPTLRAAIGRSAELAREGLADARQAVGALRGGRLPTAEQIGTLVEDFRRDTGTDVSLLIEGAPRPLSAEANLALYRGAQEALTNVVRYAPADAVTITVRYLPGRTVLTVQNQARPPAPETRPAVPDSAPAAPDSPPAAQSAPQLLAGAGGGHGLAAMRERARRAGGTARVGPAAGGWLVELEIPA